MAKTLTSWDTKYEWKAVALLTLGFGLVGLDRWVIADLAGLRSSTMVSDLKLSPQDTGNLISLLGLAWGLSALFMGNLSDRFGRRAVLVPALIVFSLLSGLSGVVGSVAAMMLMRALMGVAEGAYCPTSFATVTEASKPERRGFNLGLEQSAFALLGLGFAPIITAYLLTFASWRWVFAIVGIPGLILALLVALTIREPAITAKPSGATARKASLREMFKHPNVGLGMIGLLCAMCGIFVLSAFTPAYLTGYLHLADKDAAVVASAIGFGGFAGLWGLAAVSDVIGRRISVLAGFVVAAAFLLLFTRLGAGNILVLFVVLFISAGAAFGLLSVITGPIASEAAPLGLIASTTGVIVAVGEIFGGGVAPAVGGFIAQNYGIQNVLYLALAGLALGIVVSLFFHETAPRFAKAGRGEESALDVYEDAHPEGAAVKR